MASRASNRASVQGRLFALIILGAYSAQAWAQCELAEIQKLDPMRNAGDRFGSSVDIDGDVAVVGCYLADDAGFDAGTAYVYRFDGSSWLLEQQLFASDATAGDDYGISVSVSGDTIAVGAANPYFPVGRDAVYVYRFNGQSWVEEARITASDAKTDDWFGYSVSLDGASLAVGAWGVDEACPSDPNCLSGAAYTYRYNGQIWTDEQKIVPSDNDRGDLVGLDISVEGDYLFISAHHDSDLGIDSGSAYVYQQSGGTWQFLQKLHASDGSSGDGFSRDLCVDGEYAVIGSPFDNGVGVESGKAYVFHLVGSQWIEEAILTSPDTLAGDRFGLAVSVEDTTVIAGAYLHDQSGFASGAAYLFEKQGSSWPLNRKLLASEGDADDRFGLRVAISGPFAMIGAAWDDGSAVQSGSVYALPAFSGLDLSVTSTVVQPGDSIEFTSRFGNPGDPIMLAVVDLLGLPVFLPIDIGSFSPTFTRKIFGVVPAGATGFTAKFQALGLGRCGFAEVSSAISVTFL